MAQSIQNGGGSRQVKVKQFEWTQAQIQGVGLSFEKKTRALIPRKWSLSSLFRTKFGEGQCLSLRLTPPHPYLRSFWLTWYYSGVLYLEFGGFYMPLESIAPAMPPTLLYTPPPCGPETGGEVQYGGGTNWGSKTILCQDLLGGLRRRQNFSFGRGVRYGGSIVWGGHGVRT